MCVCVCVCACVREKKKEKERGRERDVQRAVAYGDIDSVGVDLILKLWLLVVCFTSQLYVRGGGAFNQLEDGGDIEVIKLLSFCAML